MGKVSKPVSIPRPKPETIPHDRPTRRTIEALLKQLTL